MTLEVTLVTTPEELAIAKAIRHEVFVTEQGFSATIETDEHDDAPTTRHFVGRDVEQDKYVAVARCLLTPSLRKAKVGRVAVLPECRGKKYGAALMTRMEELLRHECDTFLLSSQYDRREFYVRCGYEYVSEEIHLEHGVKHCLMVKHAQA